MIASFTGAAKPTSLPTRGIEPDRKAELADWLEWYAGGGRAVLVATHDRSFPGHRRVSLGAHEEVTAAA